MKKGLTTLLVILLAVGAVLVSCKAEVATPADELVSVSFEMDSSRALSATLEEFNKAEFFWYYAAAKTDSTGLLSGQTETYDFAGALPVSAENKGLAGYTVPNFSQGTWKFKLFAYFAVPTTEAEKEAWVYSGEATAVVLKKGGTNQVTVTVSPNPQGEGILFVDKEHISLAEYTPLLSDNQVAPVITIEAIQGGTATVVPGTNVKYTAPAGTYRVTVAYTDGFITYATGSVIATVYPSLTTTVSGTVDELVTYAQFEAVQNPDIITRTAGVDGITSTTPGDEQGNINLSEPTTVEDKKVSATVPVAAAVALLPKIGENPDPNASMSLALNVDTKDSTSTSVTYEISMTKTVTLNSEVTTSNVPEVTQFVTVQIELSAGLDNVNVTHSGTGMYPCTSKNYLDTITEEVAGYSGFFFYDPAGTLYIKTKSFSPFAVTYSKPEAVAMIGDKMYESLSAAYGEVKTGDTIVLLKDVNLSSNWGISNGKSFTVVLGGKRLTGTILVYDGDVSFDHGTISSSGQTINVFGNGKVTILSNAVVEGSYSICVFGRASTVDVYGELDAVLFVSGNIETGTSVINIKNGAKINSEGTGIALNGHATVNIEAGVEISSENESAIEVRAGNLNIAGGKFTSNATPTSFEPNGNGTTTKGVAVGISQHTTKLPINVSISGGEFYGYNALWQKDVQNNGDAALHLINLSVTEGSFYSRLGADSIVINNQDKLGTCTISDAIITGQWLTATADPVSGAPSNPTLMPGV